MSTQPAPGETTATLYQSLLGAEFERLPPVLRTFHGQKGGEAAGDVTVERPTHPLQCWIASLLRLPRPGHRPLHLRVEATTDGECWHRRFGDEVLVTRQWIDHGRLVEQAGPLRFVFAVAAVPEGPRFSSQAARLSLLPLPSWLHPRITAVAVADGDSWQINVEIRSPGGGLLTRYTGRLEIVS